MDPLAVLATPALPWAAGTGGTIELTRPITAEQLEAGEIAFVVGETIGFYNEGSIYNFEGDEVANVEIASDGKTLTISDVEESSSIRDMVRLASYPAFQPSTAFPTSSQEIYVYVGALLTQQQWVQGLKLRFGSGDWVSASQQSETGWQWVNPLDTAHKYSANIGSGSTSNLYLVSATDNNNLTGMKLGDVILPPNL